ncbi:MAG: cytochrome b/b6 domain-containing protein [Rhodanobacteraceae bacterium]
MRGMGQVSTTTIRVWDLPTRLFHWLLAVLVLLQFGTAEWGWLDMRWHMRFGYAVLVLLGFRIVWGLIGSETSRFAQFVRGPLRAWRFFKASIADREHRTIGHNPLGAWSVLAMLCSLAVQAATGLFASDDIINFGPLNGRVSGSTAELMTTIHHWNKWVLLVLIGLHIIAVLMHLIGKRDNLIGPMITGMKTVPGRADAPRMAPWWWAVPIGVLAGLLVWGLVIWGEAAPY